MLVNSRWFENLINLLQSSPAALVLIDVTYFWIRIVLRFTFKKYLWWRLNYIPIKQSYSLIFSYPYDIDVWIQLTFHRRSIRLWRISLLSSLKSLMLIGFPSMFNIFFAWKMIAGAAYGSLLELSLSFTRNCPSTENVFI